MAAAHLRAVGPDDIPTPPEATVTDPETETPPTITGALSGSTRDVLAAMRWTLASQLDEGAIASNSVATAMRELRELDRLIRVEDERLRAEREEKEAADDVDEAFDPEAI